MYSKVQFLLRRRAILPGLIAIALAGCSTAQREDHSAPPVGISPVDAPEPQSIPDRPIDLGATPNVNNGGLKSLDAQGDIGHLLGEIHSEQELRGTDPGPGHR